MRTVEQAETTEVAAEERVSGETVRLLEEREQVIERGLQTFVEVGNAIREIRDQRLYKATHGTFEEYCRARWGWKRAHAYRMVEAADTAETVSPIGDIKTESHTRPLAPLAKQDPDAAREAWKEANEVAETEERKVTANDVKTAVESRSQPVEEPEEHSPIRDAARAHKEPEGDPAKIVKVLKAPTEVTVEFETGKRGAVHRNVAKQQGWGGCKSCAGTGLVQKRRG